MAAVFWNSHNEKQVQTPVVRIGWPDQFVEHATTVESLREKYGLTVAALVAQVKAQFTQAEAVPAGNLSAVA